VKIGKYEWRVVLRNERQGFQKTVSIDATDYAQAVERAMDSIAAQRYDTREFEPISIERRAIVS
jgi:hypothetical protein